MPRATLQKAPSLRELSPQATEGVSFFALRALAGFLLAVLLLTKPQAAAAGAARAMALWADTVAPSVFPFLALLPLLTSPEACAAYRALLGRAMGALFRLPGAAASAAVVGLAAGTPASALAAQRVAAQSGMDRGQLQRLAAAIAGFSPAFLVGGVGVGLLGSAALGWRLALAQLLTQFTLLALLRRAWPDRTEPVLPADPAREEAPMRGAVLSALSICGYMVLFGAIGEALRDWLGGASLALSCLIDVPSGAARLAALTINMETKLIILAAVCGFGGLCANLQALSALRGGGVRSGEFLAMRALAGVICAGWAALLARLGEVGLPPVGRPLAAAGLCAALLSLAPLVKLGKTTLNK